ncbi:hypothetical protein [Streptomyces coeruleorubidus]|nr:hypothetical protein [Streptomyces bellus]GGU08066.1 hypothetical protein GCM10010244_37660 [Streptomyces bellus]
MLVLSGDFDTSGMDISRSFDEMTSCWKKVHRIGLDATGQGHRLPGR